MKKSNKLFFAVLVAVVMSFMFNACTKDETPTKTRMEGVWLVTEAYDSSGVDIMGKIQNKLIPLTAFYLSSDNTILSTAGPMATYLVYGDSKFTEIAAKINQYFNYANLTFNGGEFFIKDGTSDVFTIEFKLEGIGGGATNTLAEILSLFGIQAQWLKKVVYHKFMDVNVSFNSTGDQMTWVWTENTTATYNMKDEYGNYVLWGGWPINKFSRCKFVLSKKSKSLNDLTTDAYKNPPSN
jgi:hypothetical protein